MNFYGFRKIRFADTLKIDLRLEREQRNFWRFKHESFRRGRQDLLKDIKRTASSSSSSSSHNNQQKTTTAVGTATPNAVMSNSSTVLAHSSSSPSNNNTTTFSTTTSPPPPPPQDVSRLNTEVNTLKEQVSSMAKNMDELTSLVKTMHVASPIGGGGLGEESSSPVDYFSCGKNKRKKTETTMMFMQQHQPEDVHSSSFSSAAIIAEGVVQDVMMSMDVLEDAATTLLPDLALSCSSSHQSSSSLMPSPILSRSSSMSGGAAAAAGVVSAGGDDDFVDELFHAFATEDQPLLPPPQQLHQVEMMENPANKPDPQLMKRIEDSLSTIPKTMHEMVANRLIDAIAEGSNTTSSSGSSSSGPSPPPPSVSPNAKLATEKENTLNRLSSSSSAPVVPESNAEKASIPLPLAIATLKTILADYGLKVECGSSSEDAMVHRRLSNKALPLVPMHA